MESSASASTHTTTLSVAPLSERQFLVAVGIGAAVVFAAAFWLVDLLRQAGFYGPLPLTDQDVAHYQRWGDAIVRGQIPYRDFDMPYPPFALPAFVLPSLMRAPLGDIDAYTAAFERLMIWCGQAAAILVTATCWRLGFTRRRIVVAAGFVAVSPLLLGPTLLLRYDLWPAVLAAAAVWALVFGRRRLAAVALGLGVAAKAYPLVLFPILAIASLRRDGRRGAVVVSAIALGLAGGLVAIAYLVGPAGVLAALRLEIERPLHVESLAGALLLAAHFVNGMPIKLALTHGSFNVISPASNTLALIQMLVLGVLLIGIWWWFSQTDARPARIVRAAALAITAYVGFGKVASPQYLTWLIPVVPLVPGRRGLVAMAALGAALLFAVDLYPRLYFPLVYGLDPGAARVLMLRDLSVVALFAALAVPWRRLVEGSREAYRRIDERLPLRNLVPDAGTALLIVLAASLLLRAAWLSLPQNALIFDEAYYVQAARLIAGMHPPAGAHYADQPLFLDPNTEHPPLGKALIAASILFFGDNGVGWRVPSVVAGMIALVAVYGIVRALHARPWMAVLATALYSLDVLSFIHGRIGTLDMMSLAFLLLGAWLALRRDWILAGIALALGTLVKVPGVYGFGAVFVWQALALWRTRRERALTRDDFVPLAALVGAYAFVGFAGLWLLDLRFTTYTTPLDHINRMLGYGFALQGTPTGIASAPWQWLTNDGQFDYLKTSVNTLVNGVVTGSRTTVQFRAMLNPVLIGTAWIGVLYGAWLAFRRGEPVASFGLLWIVANYLPFWPLFLFSHRISYFYYILPAVPGLAIVLAAFLVHARVPRMVTIAFVVIVALAFFQGFPFKEIPG